MHRGTSFAKPEFYYVTFRSIFAGSATTASLIAILLTGATPAAATTSVAGRWLTEARDSVIEIGNCGTLVCGRVAQILKPVDNGPAVDRFNPDASLRARPILGLPVLTNFKPAGANWSGTIYDPRHGRSYRSYLARRGDGTLKVQGCIAFICQTQTWTRAR